MVNPFEADQGSFLVLGNDQDWHSLWPKSADVPTGWRVLSGPDSRSACLAYIERSWTDMRLTERVAAPTTNG